VLRQRALIDREAEAVVKRVILGVVAVLLIAAGACAGVIAAWANSEFGATGVMRFDAGTIQPAASAQAIVIDIDRFGATVPFIGQLGTTALSVSTGESGDPSDTLFIGAGATADVDAYLKGVPYAVAVRDGSQWTTRDVPGSTAAAPPRQQGFWLDDAVGRQPAITVPGLRPLTVVVMHPAGLWTGPVTLGIDFVVPASADWILGLTIAAALCVLLGALLLVLSVRWGRGRGRRRGRHEDSGAPEPQPVVAEPDPVVAEPGAQEPASDA
jgi:hypothetical protein